MLRAASKLKTITEELLRPRTKLIRRVLKGKVSKKKSMDFYLGSTPTSKIHLLYIAFLTFNYIKVNPSKHKFLKEKIPFLIFFSKPSLMRSISLCLLQWSMFIRVSL